MFIIRAKYIVVNQKEKPRLMSLTQDRAFLDASLPILLRGRARDHENAGAGVEVLFGGGVDLVDRDGVVEGVAVWLN